jgi:hypothetical protein
MSIATKTCSSCGQTKPVTEYYKAKQKPDGLYSNCKVCHREVRKQYYRRNIEANNAYAAKYQKENAEAQKQYRKEYFQRNYYGDPFFRFKKNIQQRIYLALKQYNVKRTGTNEELIGVPMEVLVDSLQSSTQPGVSILTHGPKWHIRHAIPPKCFDLSDPVQQRELFGFDNKIPFIFKLDVKK